MNDPFQLVTNCTFKGKDYLVQMCVLNSKKLELIITDKIMAEDWQCDFDASYIEALTHKTGNFKQFDVFVMMLKSGLLKTSDCISLDLLTLEDLEQLRCKKIINSHCSSRSNQAIHLNKRYLILTYSVEFDRIHYPLPLDYCGPPDPQILQGNIRRLESEIERLKQKNSLLMNNDAGDVKKLKEKIQNLLEDNKLLTNEVHRLNKIISKRIKPVRNNQVLLNSLKKLEEQVFHEKTHNRHIITKLKTENKQLKQQIEDLKKKEKYSSLKLKDPSKCNIQKSCRKFLRNSFSPENSLHQKRSDASRRYDAQFSCGTPSGWNNAPTTKSQELKTIKTSQNRFLSSSSSESDITQLRKSRSKERTTPAKQNISSKRSELIRKNSNERSRQSSVESKRNIQTQRSRVSAASEEGPLGSFNYPQSAQSGKNLRSRESSLSSRGSSKMSKVSRFSNRGSGDLKRTTSKNFEDEKEDLKFTMSDLEARIRSLQKLLSDGLHF